MQTYLVIQVLVVFPFFFLFIETYILHGLAVQTTNYIVNHHGNLYFRSIYFLDHYLAQEPALFAYIFSF